jgi:hypothetical protein
VQLQVPTGLNAWGSWVTAVADTGPLDAYLLGVYVDNPTLVAVLGTHVRIGAGVDLAAEPVAAFRPGRLGPGAGVYLPTGFPLRIRAGSRVAFSAAAASVVNLSVAVAFVLMG